MTPSVCILIVNWNGKVDTEDCLQSLRLLTYPNYTVVVVDNGSSDDSVGVLQEKFPEVQWIELEENFGFAEGNNCGIQYAIERGVSYILLLNNDTLVEAKFLSSLIQVAEAYPDIGMLNPEIYAFPSNDLWFCGGEINWQNGLTRHVTDREQIRPLPAYSGCVQSDYVTGCALLVKVQVLRKIGLLDSRFFAYYEDTDWSIRCQKAGWKTFVVPDAQIWHKVSATASPRQAFIWGHRNLFLFLWKHSSFRQFPFRFRRAVYKCLHEFVWHREPELGEAAMHGLWSALTLRFGKESREMPDSLLRFISKNRRYFLRLFGGKHPFL